MPIITAIKPQKNKKRVNIYLDNKFGFGLDLENYVNLGLKVEQELSESQINKIVKKADYAKVYNNLLRFATLRPRSEFEIKQWLKRKKIYVGLHAKLIKKLKNLELIDDQKFAQWWIEQRQQFRPKSKRTLAQELRIKGIAESLISKALNSFEIDELAIAQKELKKNKHKWARFDDKTKKQKMSAYLARKGFDWEVVKKAV